MTGKDEEGSKKQEAGESRGFRVSDRRGQPKEAPDREASPGSAGPAGKAAGTPEAEPDRSEGRPPEGGGEARPGQEAPSGGAGKDAQAPQITFTTFVFSLSSSALVQLGEIPDPFTKKVEKNLPVAQQTIDLLGMLEQKTEGNLNEEEKKTLDAVLYDLRLRFLKASGRI